MVEKCDCGSSMVQFTTDDGEQRTTCIFCDSDGPFYTEDDGDIDY